MLAKPRLTLSEWLILIVVLCVVAAMSIPLVAAVRADAQRAEAEVTLRDLHAVISECQGHTAKITELLQQRKASEPEASGAQTAAHVSSAAP